VRVAGEAWLIEETGDLPMDTDLIKAVIRQSIERELPSLPPHLKCWVQSHLIEPRQITLATDPEGKAHSQFWLITDHAGTNDSNYRVIFDPASEKFGLEFATQSGVEWFMGISGSFAETVMNM
jgi:hypothetical protein